MLARVAERHARHGAHLLLELAGRAGVDRVMAGVVRARRNLVGDKRAVLEHEELDAEHAHVAERLGDPLGGLLRLLDKPRRRVGRGHDGCESTPSRCMFCASG